MAISFWSSRPRVSLWASIKSCCLYFLYCEHKCAQESTWADAEQIALYCVLSWAFYSSKRFEKSVAFFPWEEKSSNCCFKLRLNFKVGAFLSFQNGAQIILARYWTFGLHPFHEDLVKLYPMGAHQANMYQNTEDTHNLKHQRKIIWNKTQNQVLVLPKYRWH